MLQGADMKEAILMVLLSFLMGMSLGTAAGLILGERSKRKALTALRRRQTLKARAGGDGFLNCNYFPE